MTTTFTQLGLPESIVGILKRDGIEMPFPVQAAAIPDALAGRDVSGKAATGSGKTLAFGLPLLARVEKGSSNRPRALILAPTRELADQIKEVMVPIARAMDRRVMAVYGGVGYGPQKQALRRGVDVVVATPGRLEDLMEQGAIDLSRVDIVVVDEADRMADMGFLPAVRRILDRTADKRQTLLFSATLDGDIAVLSRDYQTNPVVHEAVTPERDQPKARHHFWLINNDDRLEHTAKLITDSQRSIVFTRTRHRADRLAKQLTNEGIDAVAIHGGRSQVQRMKALKAFSTGRAVALIATDVAARGIHIDDVASVIHFDIPADSKDYIHRSGRTARAGSGGTVISLVTKDQRRAVSRMQAELNMNVPLGPPGPLNTGPQRDRVAPRTEAPTMSPSNPPSSRPAPGAPHNGAPQTGSQRIFVNNLPWSVTDQDLKKVFATYGDVVESQVITDHRGRSKGFAFVTLPANQADGAIKGLHGSKLSGRQLKVSRAR